MEDKKDRRAVRMVKIAKRKTTETVGRTAKRIERSGLEHIRNERTVMLGAERPFDQTIGGTVVTLAFSFLSCASCGRTTQIILANVYPSLS
jgi:hypothetical protein